MRKGNLSAPLALSLPSLSQSYRDSAAATTTNASAVADATSLQRLLHSHNSGPGCREAGESEEERERARQRVARRERVSSSLTGCELMHQRSQAGVVQEAGERRERRRRMAGDGFPLPAGLQSGWSLILIPCQPCL